MGSSSHSRDASVHKIWWKYLCAIRRYLFFWNSVWRPPPCWIFAISGFGTFWRDGFVFLELFTKLSWIILCNRWERPTFVPNAKLTTSCELTSVSVFTSRRICIARTMPWQDVCPSVRQSVCPYVRHTPVLCVNGYTYAQTFFTVG